MKRKGIKKLKMRQYLFHQNFNIQRLKAENAGRCDQPYAAYHASDVV